MKLFEEDRRLIQGEAASVLRLHEHLQRVPISSSPSACKAINVSAPTAIKALQTLERRGMLHEITGAKYNRTYAYTQFLEILNEDDAC